MNWTFHLGDGAPRWFLAAVLAATFAAEVLDHAPLSGPPVTAAECVELCQGLVKGWGPTYCTCAIADPGEP